MFAPPRLHRLDARQLQPVGSPPMRENACSNAAKTAAGPCCGKHPRWSVTMDSPTRATPGDTGLRVLFTSAPDGESAARMARELVDTRLAACVSILAPATSVYRWQGAVETAQEWPLMIKAAAARVPALKQALARLHPYEVPELFALPVVDGLPEYIAWALAMSSTEGDEADRN
jgi:periplasmic divalent cation tolerance protein